MFFALQTLACKTKTGRLSGPASCLPQAADQLLELGPVTGVIIPAACHQGVEDRRAGVRLGQAVPLLQHPNHIFVLQPEEGLLAIAEDFPHANGCGGGNQEEIRAGKSFRWGGPGIGLLPNTPTVCSPIPPP